MKRKVLVTGLALAFPLLANAQSSNFTLYGSVSAGVEYVNNIVTPNDYTGAGGKNSSVHFNNLTNSWPSYFGLLGAEDLGGGLSAVYKLESGFNTGTGTSGQGGRLFGREAFVGLKGDWGQVAFGRQYNMLNIALRRADFLGPNIYGLANMDTYIPNARMDNAVTYTGAFDGFQVGAAWARGRDTVNNGTPAGTNCGVIFNESSACQAYSFMLGYNTTDWGAAGAYDVISGRSTFDYYLLDKNEKDTRWTLNGWVKVAPDWKASLIYINRKHRWNIESEWSGRHDVVTGGLGALGKRSNLWSANLAWQATPNVLLDGSINYMDYKDAVDGAGAGLDSSAWLYIVRSQYSLSKRTSLYAQAAYIKNKGLSSLSATSGTAPTPAPKLGGNQTAVGVGIRHNF